MTRIGTFSFLAGLLAVAALLTMGSGAQAQIAPSFGGYGGYGGYFGGYGYGAPYNAYGFYPYPGRTGLGSFGYGSMGYGGRGFGSYGLAVGYGGYGYGRLGGAALGGWGVSNPLGYYRPYVGLGYSYGAYPVYFGR